MDHWPQHLQLALELPFMKLGMQEFVLLSFAWMDKVEYNKGHDMGGG
jgi:hypothetical protein